MNKQLYNYNLSFISSKSLYNTYNNDEQISSNNKSDNINSSIITSLDNNSLDVLSINASNFIHSNGYISTTGLIILQNNITSKINNEIIIDAITKILNDLIVINSSTQEEIFKINTSMLYVNPNLLMNLGNFIFNGNILSNTNGIIINSNTQFTQNLNGNNATFNQINSNIGTFNSQLNTNILNATTGNINNITNQSLTSQNINTDNLTTNTLNITNLSLNNLTLDNLTINDTAIINTGNITTIESSLITTDNLNVLTNGVFNNNLSCSNTISGNIINGSNIIGTLVQSNTIPTNNNDVVRLTDLGTPITIIGTYNGIDYNFTIIQQINNLISILIPEIIFTPTIQISSINILFTNLTYFPTSQSFTHNSIYTGNNKLINIELNNTSGIIITSIIDTNSSNNTFFSTNQYTIKSTTFQYIKI